MVYLQCTLAETKTQRLCDMFGHTSFQYDIMPCNSEINIAFPNKRRYIRRRKKDSERQISIIDVKHGKVTPTM